MCRSGNVPLTSLGWLSEGKKKEHHGNCSMDNNVLKFSLAHLLYKMEKKIHLKADEAVQNLNTYKWCQNWCNQTGLPLIPPSCSRSGTAACKVVGEGWSAWHQWRCDTGDPYHWSVDLSIRHHKLIKNKQNKGVKCSVLHLTTCFSSIRETWQKYTH